MILLRPWCWLFGHSKYSINCPEEKWCGAQLCYRCHFVLKPHEFDWCVSGKVVE